MSHTPRSRDYRHLLAISDHYGTFEHCEGVVPRREHGYCVDDVARVLLVVVRERDRFPALHELGLTSLAFLEESMNASGECRNRRAASGAWTSDFDLGDHWGRAVWSVGEAAASDDVAFSDRSLALFERAALRRAPWSRTMAFASLGAAAVMRVDATNLRARKLLEDAAVALREGESTGEWLWPESRLTYANALLPDALLAIGVALERPELVARALTLLDWLVARETRDGHLSLTPVGGVGPGEDALYFDQQPIEVAALADASARALEVEGGARWRNVLAMANAWFDGDNDAQAVMYDPNTGGGFDGLHHDGANKNQGAESTLALLSTRQHAFAFEAQSA